MNKKLTCAVNNRNGLLVLREIKRLGFEIEYLILHPRDEGKYIDEIISETSLPNDRILFWNKKNVDGIIEKLKSKKSEILFSVNFGYKIPKRMLDMFSLPINLHMGYLPYNKGKNPNVWAIVEGTPAGVSIHRMTEKIDEGEIYARKMVKVEIWDTGKTLYEKLERASVELVREKFIDIFEGKLNPIPNVGGTYHYAKDFRKICKIDLNDVIQVKKFIDLLRALTFPPYKNAYIEIDGKRVYLELMLYPEDQEGDTGEDRKF